MHYSDFLKHSIPVRVGARDFKLDTPTVESCLRFIFANGSKINAWAKTRPRTYATLAESFTPPELSVALSLFMRPYDPAYLVKHFDSNSLATVVGILRHTNDLARIWGFLDLPGEDERPQEPVEAAAAPVGTEASPPAEAAPAAPGGPVVPQIPAMIALIDRVARRYSTSPMEVIGWPVEAFITVSNLMGIEVDLANAALAVVEAGVDPALFDDSKVEFQPREELEKALNEVH